ncbi:hypothetical protein AVEN_139266-1 [Araneus ventricosus]|uniref:Uncharacterized protein n=1 Tax=Araneus ventricosus TaxID=182803 RepID=A0A4Y2SIM5_ARAVE|nr:hypothetical protein AVEN_139266-1 [Araneus ventricosus]
MNENPNDEFFQTPLAKDALKWTKLSFKDLDICPQREFDPNKGCGVKKNQCCKSPTATTCVISVASTTAATGVNPTS